MLFALITLLLAPLLVSGISVPPSLGLAQRASRIAVPPTLLERDSGGLDERATTCGSYITCSDGGCCAVGTYCDTVDGVPGCCLNGRVCNLPPSGSSGCVTSGYVPCADYDFCCPAGDYCYIDSAGGQRCTASSGGGGNNDGGDNYYTTSTSYYTYYEPTTTTYYEATSSTSRTTVVVPAPSVVQTTTTPTTRTTSTTPLFPATTSSPDSSVSNNNNNGAASGAERVVVQGAVGIVAFIAGAMLL